MKLLDEAGLTKLVKDLKRDVGDRVKATYDDEDKELTFTALNGDYLTVPVGQFDIDMVYPVGSIYLSVVGTNPATLFGKGTWEELPAACYLYTLQANTSGAGDITGRATFTIDQQNLPNVKIYTATDNDSYKGRHQHRLSFKGTNKSGTDTKTVYSYSEDRDGTKYKYTDTDANNYKGEHQHYIYLNGNKTQTNIALNPRAVYVHAWKRTA